MTRRTDGQTDICINGKEGEREEGREGGEGWRDGEDGGEKREQAGEREYWGRCLGSPGV